MRIEFFRLESTPGVLHWDLTENDMSLMTGGRSRATNAVEGDTLTKEIGYFINPSKIRLETELGIPATPATLLKWFRRCSLISPFAYLRILLGGTETLQKICAKTPKNFPPTLAQFMKLKAQKNVVEGYLKDCQTQGGKELFLQSVAEQDEAIRGYKSSLPSVTDNDE